MGALDLSLKCCSLCLLYFTPISGEIPYFLAEKRRSLSVALQERSDLAKLGNECESNGKREDNTAACMRSNVLLE